MLRSGSHWSVGIHKVENSIYKAMEQAIQNAEYYIYIENQFFITSTFYIQFVNYSFLIFLIFYAMFENFAKNLEMFLLGASQTRLVATSVDICITSI